MQTQQNKAIVQAYFKELNSGVPKTREMIDRYISDADIELKQHIEVFEAAFPGYVLEPKEFIAEEDRVLVSFTFKGTHENEFMGIPASNKKVAIPGMITYRLEHERIVSHDMVVDTMLLMQQLGAVPVAAE